MWLDPARIPLAAALEQSFDVIRGEWQRLAQEAGVPWVPAAYQGTWLLRPLHAWNAGELGLSAAIARNAPLCPATLRLLRRVPGLMAATFSTLEPGAHIYAHVDADQPRVIRCHLGIDVPPGNWFKIGDEAREWRTGKCQVFDGQTQHEGANLGTGTRTIFMVDVLVERAGEPLWRDS